jgi:hypothetical protein
MLHVALLATIVLFLVQLSKAALYQSYSDLRNAKNYDFIIVGGRHLAIANMAC